MEEGVWHLADVGVGHMMGGMALPPAVESFSFRFAPDRCELCWAAGEKKGGLPLPWTAGDAKIR